MKKIFTKLALMAVALLMGGTNSAWAYEIPSSYEIKTIYYGTKATDGTITAEDFESATEVSSNWGVGTLWTNQGIPLVGIGEVTNVPLPEVDASVGTTKPTYVSGKCFQGHHRNKNGGHAEYTLTTPVNSGVFYFDADIYALMNGSSAPYESTYITFLDSDGKTVLDLRWNSGSNARAFEYTGATKGTTGSSEMRTYAGYGIKNLVMDFSTGKASFTLDYTNNSKIRKQNNVDNITLGSTKNIAKILFGCAAANRSSTNFNFYMDNVTMYHAAPAATQANYTVKFVDSENNEIKSSVERSGDVNSTPILLSSDKDNIIVDSKKYSYASDDASSKSIASDGSTIVTITFNEVARYNYTIKAQNSLKEDLSVIASGSTFTDENVTMYIPLLQFANGKLYSISGENSWRSFTINEENQVVIVEYPNITENVVAFIEGEDAVGAAVSTPTGNLQLASCGHMGRGTNLSVGELAAGTYKLYLHYINTNSSGHAVTIKAGETEVGNFTLTARPTVNCELTLFESKNITFTASGSSTSGVDYIYIVKTGDAPTTVNVAVNEESNTASYVAPCNLDFTGSTLKAYVATAVTESAITLAEVTKVKAGQAIVVKGETCDVNVIAEATAPAVNLFKTGAKTVAEGENVYALGKADGLFHKVNADVEIPAGKAYIVLPASTDAAKSLSLDFGGETTGINNVTTKKMNGNAFNLMGQKVSANAKGIVIINGKKIVK